MEGRLCAEVTGLHYVSTNLGWDVLEQKWADHSDVGIESFVSPLAAAVLHRSSATGTHNESLPGGGSAALEEIYKACPCANLCHLRRDSLIARMPWRVREILAPMYQAHLPRMKPLSEEMVYLVTRPHSSDSASSTELSAIPVSAPPSLPIMSSFYAFDCRMWLSTTAAETTCTPMAWDCCAFRPCCPWCPHLLVWCTCSRRTTAAKLRGAKAVCVGLCFPRCITFLLLLFLIKP